MPQELQDALETRAPTRPRSGMAHARELLDGGARPRCDGVYIVAPYRRPTAVLELLA